MFAFQILKSLSKVIMEQNPGTDAFCITNANRPLMSVGSKGIRGGRKTYLYVEAIRKFQDEVRVLNLDEAYKLARNQYVGRMEHTFIVLKEDATVSKTMITGANSVPMGVKRDRGTDEGVVVMSAKHLKK